MDAGATMYAAVITSTDDRMNACIPANRGRYIAVYIALHTATLYGAAKPGVCHITDHGICIVTTREDLSIDRHVDLTGYITVR